MTVQVNGAWLKRVAAALLAIAVCASARAGEPTTPTPDVEEKAKKLLEQEAVNQAKLKAEVESEVESHYQAGKRMFDNFDYEGAKKELELAYRLNRERADVRSLLMQVRDRVGHRAEQIKQAMQNVAELQQATVQEKLLELNNRIDRGKRLMQHAKDDTNLTPAQRMINYESALNEFDKAQEIIKYLPVEASTSEQENELRSLKSEAGKAIAGLKAGAETSARDEAVRAARQEMDRRQKEDERKLNMALDQARVAFETGRYSLALQQAEKVLELDPGNPDAVAIKVQTQDKAFDKRKKFISDEYREQFLLNRERADRMNIPHSDYLIYPPDWRQIAQRT